MNWPLVGKEVNDFFSPPPSPLDTKIERKMTSSTQESLIKVADGLIELLSALEADPATAIRYTTLSLRAAAKELRSALAEEPSHEI